MSVEESLRLHELERLLDQQGGTALEALAEQVRRRPDKLAVHYGETGATLSYAEFDRQTDCLAGNLADLGLQGGPVAVFSRNQLATTIAMYATWKAGGVYAPVNYSYTDLLLAYQLNDCSPQLVLTDAALLPRLEAVGEQLKLRPMISVLDSDQGGDGFENVNYRTLTQPAERPDVVVAYDDPASIIYTSGTTGPSKGVLLTHRWINHHSWTMRQWLTPDDTVYNDLPLYHVGGALFNVARALWVGASVSLWDRFSPREFWNRIKVSGATTACLVDVMPPWLLQAEPREDDRINSLNKVHMQPLPANHQEICRRFGIDFVSTGFGQSETGAAILALLFETAPGEGTPQELWRGLTHAQIRDMAQATHTVCLSGDRGDKQGLMGRPVPFVEAVILNDRDQVCLPGETGQLAIRPKVPALIVQEYVGKPEATLAAFRNLWFHTGDAAYMDDDGLYYFVDRLGDRIRVRGENVSSVHVEEILAAHPSVALAAVVAVPSKEGYEDEVAAFVEFVPGRAATIEDLVAHCEATMPKFMRPAHFHVVAEMPRTPTNKIEKYKLRNLLIGGSSR